MSSSCKYTFSILRFSLSWASFVDSATLPELQDDNSIVLPLSETDCLTESLFADDDALDEDFKLADRSS